jgi:hypothetical protein
LIALKMRWCARLAEEVLALIEELDQFRAAFESWPAPPPRGAGWTNLKAAAGACGYDKETIRRWAERGEIDAKKYGGRWIIRLSSVMRRAKKYSSG